MEIGIRSRAVRSEVKKNNTVRIDGSAEVSKLELPAAPGIQADYEEAEEVVIAGSSVFGVQSMQRLQQNCEPKQR